MKRLLFQWTIMGSILALVLADCQSEEAGYVERPNLVLIIADDMAWDDMGAYGHPHIQTPNLDQMAADGMRFDNAFLTTSSCSPSRSSIITGLYPHNTGAEQLHWPLPEDQVTFVELLREAGYWTAQAGKWHLGDAVKDRFDLVRDMGWARSMENKENTPTIELDGSGSEYWVSVLQDRPADRPFFLWLAASDPHRVYHENTIARPHTPADVIVPPYLPDTEEVRQDLALYYDEVSRLDEYVGSVLDELERQGIADETLVLFISDNGRPFPRDKTTLFDGGIKTPWVIRWPNRIAPGTTTKSLVSAVDIAPTFLQLAGAATPPHLEGADFTSLFDNTEDLVRDAIYAEDHWHDHDDFSRAVRTQEFKYIRNFFPEVPNTPPADALVSQTFKSILALRDEGELSAYQSLIFQAPRPEEALYDILNDPHELNNLALDPEYAETLTYMQERLQAFRDASGDNDPAFRTPDEFDRITGMPNENRSNPRVTREALLTAYPID